MSIIDGGTRKRRRENKERETRRKGKTMNEEGKRIWMKEKRTKKHKRKDKERQRKEKARKRKEKERKRKGRKGKKGKKREEREEEEEGRNIRERKKEREEEGKKHPSLRRPFCANAYVTSRFRQLFSFSFSSTSLFSPPRWQIALRKDEERPIRRFSFSPFILRRSTRKVKTKKKKKDGASISIRWTK